jgi:hypothetical protein
MGTKNRLAQLVGFASLQKGLLILLYSQPCEPGSHTGIGAPSIDAG